MSFARRRLFAPVSLTVLGALCCLGPLVGLLGTVIGMVRAFVTLGASGAADAQKLSSDVGLALATTVAGLVCALVGVVLLVVGILWTISVTRRRSSASA